MCRVPALIGDVAASLGVARDVVLREANLLATAGVVHMRELVELEDTVLWTPLHAHPSLSLAGQSARPSCAPTTTTTLTPTGLASSTTSSAVTFTPLRRLGGGGGLRRLPLAGGVSRPPRTPVCMLPPSSILPTTDNEQLADPVAKRPRLDLSDTGDTDVGAAMLLPVHAHDTTVVVPVVAELVNCDGSAAQLPSKQLIPPRTTLAPPVMSSLDHSDAMEQDATRTSTTSLPPSSAPLTHAQPSTGRAAVVGALSSVDEEERQLDAELSVLQQEYSLEVRTSWDETNV